MWIESIMLSLSYQFFFVIWKKKKKEKKKDLTGLIGLTPSKCIGMILNFVSLINNVRKILLLKACNFQEKGTCTTAKKNNKTVSY